MASPRGRVMSANRRRETEPRTAGSGRTATSSSGRGIPPLRPRERSLRLLPRHPLAGGGLRDPLLVTGRAPRDGEVMVERGAGGFRPDGDHRAGRDERSRHLRTSVQQHAGREPEARADLAGARRRRQDPDQHGQGLRAKPLATLPTGRRSRPPSPTTTRPPRPNRRAGTRPTRRSSPTRRSRTGSWW